MPTPLASTYVLTFFCSAITLSAIVLALRLFRDAGAATEPVWRSPFLVASLILAGFLLFISPYQASNLAVSDALEYSVAAHRYWFNGTYSLGIGEQSLPPRYPPAFSLLVLMPSYAIFGPEIGNSILPICVMALVALLALSRISYLISGPQAGLLAPLLLLALPEFRTMARLPMTDLPALALGLLALLRTLIFLKQPKNSITTFLEIGFYLGLAIAFRSTNIVLALALLPFLLRLHQKERLKAVAIALVPIAAAAFSVLLYQHSVFADLWRSGYHFWVAIPYDFPGLTFSSSYMTENIALLLQSASFVPLLFVTLALFFLNRRAHSQTAINTPLIVSTFVLLFSLLLIFIAYFYCTRRFFLPLSTWLIPLTLGFGLPLLSTKRQTLLLSFTVVIVIFSVGLRWVTKISPPERRVLADALSQTPENSAILAELDPAYAERMVIGSTQRSYIPMSREVEFASKVLAPTSLGKTLTQPKSWHPHRSPEALQAGAIDAVPWVAIEQPEKLRDLLASGRPVYVGSPISNPKNLEELQQYFKLIQVSPHLFSVNSANQMGQQ
jgi:hypothetical protein